VCALRYGWDGDVVIVLWVHDELVACCRPEIADQVGEIMVRHAREPGEFYHFKVPLDAEYKIGRSWAGETEHHVGPPDAPTPTQRESPEFFNGFAAICIHCRQQPPDGLERVSAYNGAWLHPRCEDAFIRMRMTEEGVPWENPDFAAASSPSPQPQPALSAAVESTPIVPPPAPSPSKPRSASNGGYPHPERDDIGRKVGEFIYRDLKGAPYLKVAKYVTGDGEKHFPQYRWENGRWVKGKPKGSPIPYRLPQLLAAPPGSTVEVCEGEKDADSLAALGLIATTNPGGAGKWNPSLNKWLTGFARANVYEDNDEPGRRHAAQVAASLCGDIPDIRILTFRELPEKGDVSDWLKNKTLADLVARAEQALKFAALESVCAADEEIKNLTWVWPGRFALGKIGLIVGLPDEGKGLTLSDIMARITRGALWPCNEGTAPLGNVLLLTAEDDISDTIIPRLLAAGADLKRVTIVKMIRDTNGPRMFSLISDLPALRQKVREIGDVRMIVIDPISSYHGIGKIDSFRATDVRAVLGPLKEFAAELALTVLGIMHFNKKTDVTNVLLRISDSLAYGAAARHVYGVVNDPDNFRKLFVKGKNNLAPAEQKTLAFTFNEREVGTDKQTGAPIRAPYIVWFRDPVDITAAEAMQAATENKSPSARDDAKNFLKALLSNGPIASKDVYETAKENGISRNTLQRAKNDLDIDVRKDGPIVDGERVWQWHLPEQENPTNAI
jgi:hypothetical protein